MRVAGYYNADRPGVVIIGTRIRQRLKQLEMSQSELARRVRLNQSTIAALLAGRSRSSSHLHVIARELRTTPSFLTGEIDDPDLNAPPALAPVPALRPVLLPVMLPSEEAMAEMFLALLDGIDPAASQVERARQLARRLPVGLSQLQNPKRVATRDSAGREKQMTASRLIDGGGERSTSITLPSVEALEDAMAGLLEEGHAYSPAELVHEIATQLPIILQAAQHEIAAPSSDLRDSGHERSVAFGNEQPSAQQGRRT